MAVGRINEVAALTDFSYEKMFGPIAGGRYWPQNRGDRINEVAVRRGSTVFGKHDGFNARTKSDLKDFSRSRATHLI